MSADGDARPVVLVLLGAFSRSLEATGPRQSMIMMAHNLSDRFRFRVIGVASADDEPGRWSALENIEFLPLERGRHGVRGLRHAIVATAHDLLLINSIFDKKFGLPALVLRRLGRIPRKPALLAPRGEFSPGALAIASVRKRAYLAIVRAMGLLNGVALQTTSESEARETRAALPFFRGPICVTPNIRKLPPLPRHSARGAGEPLRVAFLSRIDRKKNLLFALEALARVRSPVIFSIFGPSSHDEYWRACQARARDLPQQVEVVYRGAIPPSQVLDALAGQDLFFLPTLGENYGHAIIDSFLAGTPVLISDRTPWRDLAAHRAGWDLPLGDPADFTAVIERAARAGADEREEQRAGARAYGEAALDTEGSVLATADCFNSLIARGSPEARP